MSELTYSTEHKSTEQNTFPLNLFVQTDEQLDLVCSAESTKTEVSIKSETNTVKEY
jgi:hypothetical protein